MPAKRSSDPGEIFQFKVTLVGSEPPIWRRLLVPSDMTFAQLHNVLQVAMGWEDDHLHEFETGRRRIGQRAPEDDFMGTPAENEARVQLSSVFSRVGAKAIYTYDFGDGWRHEIVLEKRLPADPNISYPACTGGKRAGPPEDCGGIYGYCGLLEALADPEDERREETLEWLGEGYDPEAFSPEDVNRKLAPRRRTSRS